MSDHHHHHHDHSGPIAIGDTAAKVVVGLLTGIGVLVLIGLFWLWPSHQHVDIPLPMQNGGGGAVHTEAGTVTMQELGPCGSLSNGRVFDDTPNPPRANGYNCQRSLIAIGSGPDEGKHTLFEIAPGPGQPDLRVGDDIRIVRQADPGGTTIYSFDDYARGLPLTIIALAFAAVIVIVARWRGLRAVLGLGFAFGVLVMFLLPALLDGKPAVPVALVAGSLILYAVLYLAHGVNLRTSSALLGTLSAMVLAAVLSWVALKITHLTGLSEEQNANVATYLQHVSITGLLLAGFIIGSLGVLNDVTITQASAAFELAALDEKASRREIFTAAMRVGRDHIASTVYTLVLAYAGGALPLLLLFSVAGRSFRDVLTGDAVGIEITRSAVGGICLALSVPLTTAIAVMLARPLGYAPASASPRRSRRVRGAESRSGAPARGPESKVDAAQRGSAAERSRAAAGAAAVTRRSRRETTAPPEAFDGLEDDATPPEGFSAYPAPEHPREGQDGRSSYPHRSTGGAVDNPRHYPYTESDYAPSDSDHAEPGYAPPEPSNAEPGYAPPEPGYAEPGYAPSDPGYAEPGYAASNPGYAEPEYTPSDTGYAEPGYTPSAPGFPEPGYTPSQPGYAPSDPAYAEPGHTPSGPGYAEPGYAERGYPTPSEPGYAGPGYTPSEPEPGYAAEPGYAPRHGEQRPSDHDWFTPPAEDDRPGAPRRLGNDPDDYGRRWPRDGSPDGY